MDIYIVQPNDTIEDIANKFGVSVKKLIQDNELKNPDQLISGQTIVIVYPEQIYTIQDGDTLEDISEMFNVSIIQLLRNNPYLSSHIPYPGDIITISYNTVGKLSTNGFAYPFINIDTLKKTLPSLTFISVYNFKATETGDLLVYYDDTDIIQVAKVYRTIPLMMLTSFSLHGNPDTNTAETILTNLQIQEKFINTFINIIIERGYLGINFYFDYLTINNLDLHVTFIINISNALKERGLFFLVTIDPTTVYPSTNNPSIFNTIDYGLISDYVDNIAFLHFTWGINYGPPSPANSIEEMRYFTNYLVTNISPKEIALGFSLISYDWELPYIPGDTHAHSLSINDTLVLALNTGSTIQFDEVSQAPFFTYNFRYYTEIRQHILWSVDARSVYSFLELMIQSDIQSCSFWNLMFYYAQLWLVINSQFEVEKLLETS